MHVKIIHISPRQELSENRDSQNAWQNPCVSQIHDSYFLMLLALHKHISTLLYSPFLETLPSRIAMCGEAPQKMCILLVTFLLLIEGNVPV